MHNIMGQYIFLISGMEVNEKKNQLQSKQKNSAIKHKYPTWFSKFQIKLIDIFFLILFLKISQDNFLSPN